MAARRLASPRAGSRARGFTLIEVLVALAIIAIALAASLRAVGTLANGEADLQRRLLAGWSADNALAELKLARAWPELGDHQFDCTQGNQPLVCTEHVSATPNPVFRRVELQVTAPGSNVTLARLASMLPNETNRSL